MASIPQYKQQRLPSTNVGAAPLPMSGANTGAQAIGQGLQQLGAGVSNFAESMFKIEMQNQRSKDLIAETQLKADIRGAELDFEKFKTENGDTSTWSEFQQQQSNDITSKVNGYDWGNSRSKEQALSFLNGYTSNREKVVSVDIAQKNTKDSIVLTKADFVGTVGSIDSNDDLVKNSEESYRIALSSTYSPEIIDLMVKDAYEDGLKSKAISIASAGDFATANKIIEQMSFTDPKDRIAMQNSISAIQTNYEKENKNTAEKAITEEILLEASKNGWESAEAKLDNPDTLLRFTRAGFDMKGAKSLRSDIREILRSEKNKSEELSIKNRDAYVNDSYIRLAGNKEDLFTSMGNVDSQPDISVGDKIIAKDKIKSFYNSLHSSQVYNPTSAIQIRQDMNEFTSGNMTQEKMLESFVKNSPSLESGVRNSILDKIFNMKGVPPVLRNALGRIQKNLLDMWNDPSSKMTEAQYNKYDGYIFKWAQEHPKASDEELTKVYDDMIKADKKNWIIDSFKKSKEWINQLSNNPVGNFAVKSGKIALFPTGYPIIEAIENKKRSGEMQEDIAFLNGKAYKIGDPIIGADGKQHIYEGNGEWSK